MPNMKFRRILKCKRCCYQWMSRTENPVLCPRCKTPYWNTTKTQKFDKVSKYKLEEMDETVKTAIFARRAGAE